MTFEEALQTELNSITEISDKIFPLTAQEGTKAPYIIYTSSEGIYDKVLEGFLSTKEVSCEIDIIHISYSAMKALSKIVINKLKSFEGRVIGNNGMFVEELTFDDDSPELYESEINAYRKIINFKVYFEEE